MITLDLKSGFTGQSTSLVGAAGALGLMSEPQGTPLVDVDADIAVELVEVP